MSKARVAIRKITTGRLTVADEHGFPASNLTDNARLHRPVRRREERLRVPPGPARHHPEERPRQPPPDPGQGLERFHQTLKKWLAQQPPAATLAELQDQLDRFRETYNHHRPHRELDRRTPAAAYAALPKAEPAGQHRAGPYRLRYDRLDTLGKMTIRRAGRMHHLGVGAAHARKRVLASPTRPP